MFEYIKEYYKDGLYTEDDLKTLLAGEMLTQDEYDSLINPTPTTDSDSVAVSGALPAASSADSSASTE